MRYFLSLIILLFMFMGGFFTHGAFYPPHAKPYLPEAGPIYVIRAEIEDVGSAACFDEESFNNLVYFLQEVGDEFTQWEDTGTSH